VREGRDGAPADDAPLSCRRGDFQLPEGVRFLNCAYMAPLPRVTEEAIVDGLRRKREPSGIGPDDFFRDVEEIRRRFGALVGGGPERVALLPSASYGIAICARNLPVRAGQSIVVTHEQFPGNVYAWRRAAAETGATIRTVAPGTPEGRDAGDGVTPQGARAARWSRRLLEAIDADTAVVAIPQVHWTDGTRFSLAAVCARARDVGAAVVVDATQSVGSLPLDVGELRPDAVISAAYKWLLGPYGVALGWFGDRFDDGVPLEETWMGREGSEDFQHLVDYRDAYQPGARRYDVGEVANFALVPGVRASLGLLAEWRPERIQRYCRTLLASFLDEVRELGFGVDDDPSRAWHIVGIRMRRGVELARLKERLDARGVSVSLRGSALRVSPNVYNEVADVEALAEVLRGL